MKLKLFLPKEKKSSKPGSKGVGGRKKNKQVIMRKYLEGNNLWNFEIIFWSSVSYHFSISHTFYYKALSFPTMLQYAVQNVISM